MARLIPKRVRPMDKFTQQLRDDADRIEVVITPELDNRIRASLLSVRQETHRPAVRGKLAASFWWASSLTGVAATVAIIGVLNLSDPDTGIAITEPPVAQFVMPKFTWQPKAAILTATLEQELEDIESDLKKAEQVIREDFDDIGI